MKPIVLFGARKIAEVLLYYFRHHSDREVVAVTVDREYLPETSWNGLPTVAFDEVAKLYPPSDHDMFVALGYHDMNRLRAKKCDEARDKGYKLLSYIHPDAGVPKDCQIGENCFLMQNTLIHPCVKLGNDVFVWSGAMVGHHSTIGDHCWLTSCANISGVVTVGRNCFFGVNATVGHSVTIGNECFVGANALVTKCTDDGQVFVADSTKPFRLNSSQFLRFSNFGDL